MYINLISKSGALRWVPGALTLLLILLIACGTAAPPTDVRETSDEPEPEQQVAQPTPLAIEATATPAPAAATAAPAPTAVPDVIVSAKDTMTFVTNEEPTTIGAASEYCGGNIQNTICDDMASDPFTWIDDQNDFQVVGLTGIEGWEQLEPNRWRFRLRDGVTFHNGAPWNAEQAKFWVDWFGDEETSGHHNSNDFSFHGVMGGEVVDDLTLDVVCGSACPILPRTTIFTKFQDVGWFESASEEEIQRMTVGLGPYKIVEWRSGQDVRLEAYEGYNPNPSTEYSRAPSIQNVVQIWRNEPGVRGAVIAAGEADWAEINPEDRDLVPKWKSATNNEVYIYAIDTVHHPELRKLEVRKALALAIDCETLMETIFDGLFECWTAVSGAGTVGITPENSAPHPYEPEQARELLQQANYDPSNVIELGIRANRIPKDVEYGEAVVTFWREVGINAELQVLESSVRSDRSYSNCGNQRTREEFMAAPGADHHEKCANLGPGAPTFSSMQILESATSNESLDFQRHALQRLSCFSRSSGVCFSDMEKAIEEATVTPTGDLRRQRLEAIADRVHDEVLILPNFQVVQVYGLSEDLEWEPHYAPRIRANTMFFSQ
jgi:peptide/nickel transport system substrate-binding protein